MNTIEGKSQRIQIYETSIEIENKNPPSFRGTRISCDEITRVEQRGTSVVISRRGFHSAQTVVEFKDYFDAEKAASAIYNTTPISRPIIIERNTLYIGRRYDHYGKSVHMADIQEASADRDGKLTIRCKRSFNSFSIQRKSSYDAKKEADMINQWLQKAQNSTSQSSSFSWFGSDGKKTSPINMQTRQDTWEPTQTRPQANPKKRKTSPIRNLAAIVILLALLSFFNSTNDSSKESNNNESSAHYTAPKAMIDYIGLTVGDIEDMFGTDYVVDYWEGGYNIYYSEASGCPYIFLFNPSNPPDNDERPDRNYAITGITCSVSDTVVFGSAKIGMTHNDFAAAIGQTYTAYLPTDPAELSEWAYTLPGDILTINVQGANDLQAGEHRLTVLEDNNMVAFASLWRISKDQ